MSAPPDYRVVCMTSDLYLPAVRVFAHQYNKYWRDPPPCTVVGFSHPDFPLPANFTFVSLGPFSDFPFNRWSDALHKFLVSIDDDVFVLMLEDYWITRGVDAVACQVLVDYARQFSYVAKIDLCGDRLYAYGADLTYGSVAHLDLVKSMPGSPYHLSLMTGIWSRKHLLSALIPGESPHDLELVGTTRLSHNQDVIVLGTRQWPIRHTLAFRGAEPHRVLLDEMAPADVEELRSLGYLSPWEKDNG